MRYHRRFRKHRWLFFLLILLILIGGFLWFKNGRAQAPAISQSNNQNSVQKPEPKLSLPLIDLQPTVDAWAAKQGGTAGVVIIDLANSKTVSSLNPDKTYFTASLYKLYVAYYGYQKVADGTYKLDDPYLSGYTRGKCLDAMIRDSYSPCGEKMWAELGKETLNTKLKTYGLKNTNVVGLQTSAADAAIILQRLFERRELTEQYTQLFLDSMKTQPAIYRRGLPSGFSQSTVYNKVGWNENLEWHDTAIVTLANGRSYVVAVLTRSVGSANIAALGRAIEAKLSE